MKKISFLLFLVTIAFSYSVHSQCVECTGSTSNGTNASAIGSNNSADGGGSIVMGTDVHTGSYGTNTIAIGGMVESTGPYSFVFGTGAAAYSGKRLVNSIPNTLMIGFNSTKPTLFVSASATSFEYNKTGKVGIGNVTSPLAKLHLRADEEEIAAMFIEPNVWDDGTVIGGGGIELGDKGESTFNPMGAYLLLGNENHGIGALNHIGLIFNTETNFIFNYGRVGINTAEPGYNLDVAGDINFSGNLYKNGVLLNDSPWERLGNNIVYEQGKVGIGTTNFTGDYGLYVNNGILTSEVMVLNPAVWYDLVFENSYPLMSISDLEVYIETNKKLPDVPSEKTVMENGYGLVEMNGILLKKIEELTLYIIEQQKQLSKLSQRVEDLNKSKE